MPMPECTPRFMSRLNSVTLNVEIAQLGQGGADCQRQLGA